MNKKFNETIVETNGVRSIAGGGTNAGTATGALANLGGYPISNPSGFITGIENLVYTTGNQIISGIKTFTDELYIKSLGGQIAVLHVESGKVGINNENPQAILDVSGSALFSERPTVNGTGILLSGDINTSNFYTNDNLSGFITGDLSTLYPRTNPSGFITGIENLVYITGSQVISGVKTFANELNILVNPGEVSTLYVSSGLIGINTESPSGALDVSGSVFFNQRPTVNGTGVLLEGEVQNNTIISGVLYSAQVNVKNNHTGTLYKGQPVYINGAAGGNILVGLASNTGEASSSKTLGLIYQDSLTINASGTVITDGLLSNFNVGSAAAGDPIWLGPTGNLIYGLANKPVAPNHLVYLGVVTRTNNNGEVFVKVQNGYELDELHDVAVKNSPTGQFLFKNADSQWSGKYLQISDVSGLESSVTLTGTQTLTNKTIEGGTFTNGYTEEASSATISSSTYTIDLLNGTVQLLTLSAASITFTFPTTIAGKSFFLTLKQDGIGGRAVAWPSSVKWAGGTTPAITTTASKSDVFSFVCVDGASWIGIVVGQNYTI